MYLYNVIFGNYNIAPDPWSHIMDEHGNHFITKEDIRQRMRLDKSIQPVDYPHEGELEPIWKSSNIQCYQFLPNVKWVNNNKNMNPLLLANKVEDGSTPDSDDEQIVVYVTVQANYHITRFTTKYKILQTYHKKDVLQGCAVVLTVGELKADDRHEIIQFSAYDDKKKDFANFTVEAMSDDLTKINTKRKSVTDPKLKARMQQQIDKYKNSYMGFKIRVHPGDSLTSLYIISDRLDPSVHEKIDAIAETINGFFYFQVDMDSYENDEEYQKDFFAQLKNEIEKNRIRAVTLVGVRLPLPIIKQMKLLYVFDYRPEQNLIVCKKAN